METSVPATSSMTPSVRLGSILVLILEPVPSGVTGSVFLRGPAV